MDSVRLPRYLGLAQATAVLAILPLLAGVAGYLPAHTLVMHYQDIDHFLYGDLGKATPRVLGYLVDSRSDVLCLVLAIAGAATALAAAVRRKPGVVLVALGGSTFILLVFCSLAAAEVKEAREWMLDHTVCCHELIDAERHWGLVEKRAQAQPGRAAQIAEEVVACVRTSLRDRTTRETLPDGVVREVLTYAGPGTTPVNPAPERRDSPVGDERVILPQCPADSVDCRKEPVAVFPPPDGAQPSRDEFEAVRWGHITRAFPNVYWVQGADDPRYGYSFTLERPRVDARGRIGWQGEGTCVDGMYLLTVYVIRARYPLSQGVADEPVLEESFECLVLR